MEGVQECGAKEIIITSEGRSKKKILTDHFFVELHNMPS
jgi:hypothetical protein